MTVYRLANARRTNGMSGEGARRAGSRWNNAGTPVLCAAGSKALATLEVLVRTPLAFVPDNYRMLTLNVPDDSLQSLSFNTLPNGWNSLNPPGSAKQLIDEWISGNRLLVLKVPSAVVEGDFNFLINPQHARMTKAHRIDNQPCAFNKRLFRP